MPQPTEQIESHEQSKLNQSANSVCGKQRSSNVIKTPDKSVSFMPKRVLELTPLKSDSEDDEEKKQNPNNALLDNSFIYSPTHVVDELQPTPAKGSQDDARNRLNKPKSPPENAQNNTLENPKITQVPVTSTAKNSSILSSTKQQSAQRGSFLTNREASTKSSMSIFQNRHRSHHPPSTPSIFDSTNGNPKRVGSLGMSSSRPHSVLKSINEQRTVDNSPQRIKPDTGRSHFADSGIESNDTYMDGITPLEAGTPVNRGGNAFATPQVKPYQKSSLLSSNVKSKKQINTDIRNEFRAPKILFTTPMPISRLPPSTLDDDSLMTSFNENSGEKQENKENNKVKPEVKKSSASKDLFASNPDKNDSKKTSDSKVIMINKSEYILGKKLGSGGSSTVYLATNLENNTTCAVKIADLLGGIGYLDEVKLLEKLQGSDTVIRLFDYSYLPAENKLYLVMENGETDLNEILNKFTTNIPLYTLMKYLHQMLEAVNYIHTKGVIHSDLKPANFLMSGGRLKLIDFGIASNISIDMTSIIKFVPAGTFNYISPEALTDTNDMNGPNGADDKTKPKIKISTKSDVWSLGCILYLLLYKKTPFSHLKNIYSKVSAITNPSTVIEYPPLPNYYPSMLLEMVQACLQHNPKARPSVQDLLNYPFNMVIPI